MYPNQNRFRAFTLVELLTVIGIIGLLLALLMPALVSARRNAQAAVCASNLRQLCNAMISYAGENRGYFPPNVGALNFYWYNRYAIGKYIKAPYEMSNSEQCIGSVFVCPADLDDSTGEPVRSYSMNIYASAMVSPYVQMALEGPTARGKLWKHGVSSSSNMILLIESFSYEDWPAEHMATDVGTGVTGKWASPAVVGFSGLTPGSRFVSGGPLVDARFGQCSSQICYFRHRRVKEDGTLGDTRGRTHIGFADSHVAAFTANDLVDPNTGISTFEAMWSPIDREIEAAYSGTVGP
jgi:competence protein ComGC